MKFHQNDIIILGAGLTGLGLGQKFPGSIIFEKSKIAGGHCKSNLFQGFHFDEGAHICHSKNPEWIKLINADDKQINNKLTSKVANYDGGKIFGYPIQDYLYALSNEEKIKIIKNLVNKASCKEPINYEEWLIDQYGDYLTQNYYTRFTKKYWRTNVSAMGTDWLKGRLIKTNTDRLINSLIQPPNTTDAVFDKFYYPKNGGFASFFNTIVEQSNIILDNEAIKLNLREKVVLFKNNQCFNYKRLFSTIPLPSLVDITQDCPEYIKECKKNLKYTNLMQLNAVFEDIDSCFKTLSWFYVYDSDVDISRVCILNNLTGSKGPPYAIQAEIFRRNDEDYDSKVLVKKALKDLLKILKVNEQRCLNFEMKRVKFSYVVPTLGIKKHVKQIKDYFKEFNVITCGLYGDWEYKWSDQAYYGYKKLK